MNLVCRSRTFFCPRFECVNISLRMKSQVSKQVGILGKLLSKTPKKRYFITSEGRSSAPSISGNPSIKKGTSIRSAVLNKLFMNYVTDIMATGSFSDYLIGHGIEITHVKVSPDYHFMNIYWIAKDSTDINNLEQTLHKLAFPLRHELSQLHLVGIVPRIVFVRNVLQARLAELDQLIKLSDKGNDDENTDDSESTFEEVFPQMPMNVFGLDHDKIVNKLMQAKARSKSALTQLPSSNLTVTSLRSIELKTESLYNQREAIRKFLRLKKISRMKRPHKENKHPYEDESLLYESES